MDLDPFYFLLLLLFHFIIIICFIGFYISPPQIFNTRFRSVPPYSVPCHIFFTLSYFLHKPLPFPRGSSVTVSFSDDPPNLEIEDEGEDATKG